MMWGREGLYGRPRPVHLASILGEHDHIPPHPLPDTFGTRATTRVPTLHPHHLCPYSERAWGGASPVVIVRAGVERMWGGDPSGRPGGTCWDAHIYKRETPPCGRP